MIVNINRNELHKLDYLSKAKEYYKDRVDYRIEEVLIYKIRTKKIIEVTEILVTYFLRHFFYTLNNNKFWWILLLI